MDASQAVDMVEAPEIEQEPEEEQADIPRGQITLPQIAPVADDAPGPDRGMPQMRAPSQTLPPGISQGKEGDMVLTSGKMKADLRMRGAPKPPPARQGPAVPVPDAEISLEPQMFICDYAKQTILVLAPATTVVNTGGQMRTIDQPGYDIAFDGPSGSKGIYWSPPVEEMAALWETRASADGSRFGPPQDGYATKEDEFTGKGEQLVRRIKRMLLFDHSLAKSRRIRLADEEGLAAKQKMLIDTAAMVAAAGGDPTAILAQLPRISAGKRGATQRVGRPPVIPNPNRDVPVGA